MSKLRIALLTGLFTVLSQIAVTSTASASLMIAYQPKLPKSLR
ncbi:cyclic lactone autoinducer peptide [Natranaerobius trueperi]|nr:cyclic lactone autoinducer peptide [Natranaerobius trueperi]